MGDMNSGNSGSMQSSSSDGGGDDQEFESRGKSISEFFDTAAFDSTAAPPLRLYSLNNGSSSSSSFDHHQVSNYFDPPILMSNNINTNNDDGDNNNNLVWPNKYASIRPPLSSDDPNCTTDYPFGYARFNNPNQHHLATSTPQAPPQQPPPPVAAPPSSSSDHIHPSPNRPSSGPGPGPGRNPKKRPRASRRAPTTVLTTDTTNFRQMVQEFTGIPAPPFSAFSGRTRTRLDLFSGLPAGPGAPYVLRPFPHQLPLFTPPSSTPLLDPSPSLGPKTTTASGSFVNEFGLDQAQTACSTTVTSTGNVTPVGLGGPSWNPLRQGLGLGLTQGCSVDDGGGNYCGGGTNAASGNHGGAARGEGEGMVDLWICSSD